MSITIIKIANTALLIIKGCVTSQLTLEHVKVWIFFLIGRVKVWIPKQEQP